MTMVEFEIDGEVQKHEINDEVLRFWDAVGTDSELFALAAKVVTDEEVSAVAQAHGFRASVADIGTYMRLSEAAYQPRDPSGVLTDDELDLISGGPACTASTCKVCCSTTKRACSCTCPSVC